MRTKRIIEICNNNLESFVTYLAIVTKHMLDFGDKKIMLGLVYTMHKEQ